MSVSSYHTDYLTHLHVLIANQPLQLTGVGGKIAIFCIYIKSRVREQFPLSEVTTLNNCQKAVNI